MKSAGKIAALILFALPVAGCRHKARTAPPQAAQAPVLPPSNLTKNLPLPELPQPEMPKINPPAPETPPKPRPKPHRTRRKPKTEPSQTPDQTSVKGPDAEQNPAGNSADSTPIGQLSAAGENVNTPRHHEIQEQLNTIEAGLGSIKRTLSPDEQTTATQIRTFLAKGREALKQEDLDGATTLVTKAQVLLDELTKQ